MDRIFQCVFLFLSYYIQASRAVTPLVVQNGSDVQLDVSDAVPEGFSQLVWKVNETSKIVTFSRGGKPEPSGVYKGRVEFPVTNYSVKLKNVQHADSGYYTAVAATADTDQTVAGYRVTVQAPVSPVYLTVASVSSSSDSCNLTVSCRTQDSHISTTFTCVRTSCSDDGDRSDTTTSGAVLHVYLEDNSIKCNHSNQISCTTNQGAPAIQDFCSQQPPPVANTAQVVVGPVVAGVLVALVVAVVVVIICKKNKDKKQINDNTIYDVPQNPSSAQTVTSTYATVQFHKGPEPSTETEVTAKPETIYAQVNKVVKSDTASLESPTHGPSSP